MIYRDFAGKRLSMLGMGTMRLPVIDNTPAKLDEPAVAQMVAYAMEQGINYYDTAWGYHGGNAETVIGRQLAAYPRESFYLADKFPGYDLANMDKVEQIFEKQLEKCQTGYFDFYLIHNVFELNIDDYLDPRHGIVDYLRKQRDAGRIRHLGCSIHGSLAVMQRFLDAYGEYMEFAQLQLNWLDWEFQDSRGKVEALRRRGIPVWVMEPLRGGRLVKLDERQRARLSALRPAWTAAEWAFRFLQSIDGVAVILTGASDLTQLQENVRIMQTDEPLTEAEIAELTAIARQMTAQKSLPCTACGYCLDHCPRQLNIPELLRLYNEHNFSGGGFLAPMVLGGYTEEQKPAACVGCGSCSAVCPQQLDIAAALADLDRQLQKK
ncbi:MAG: aldo/keto reductase [Bacillota bacterium]|nr:aldo/keto reductase [Bacillota bacterium]